MADLRQVVITEDGPVLVSGPVEVVLPDGRRVRSDRPVTALCVCRRSRYQPFCDTSHRQRVRGDSKDADTTNAGTTDADKEDRAQQDSAAAG